MFNYDIIYFNPCHKSHVPCEHSYGDARRRNAACKDNNAPCKKNFDKVQKKMFHIQGNIWLSKENHESFDDGHGHPRKVMELEA